MMRTSLFYLIGALALTGCDESGTEADSLTVSLSPAAALDAAEMVEGSDAVFVGVVTRIDYRVAEPGVDGKGLPFTFVTYAVEDGISGVESGESYTLRFLGGRFANGRILVASEIPRFRVGERDLLFVQGNGKGGCPLRGCAAGRMRIVEGRVYDDGGHAILLDESEGLTRGPRQELPGLGELVVDGTRIARYRSPEPVESSAVYGVEVSALLPLLAEAWQASGLPERAAESLDPDAPFAYEPAPRPAGLPRPPISAEPPLNDADREELEALERNGFDPILPR